MAKAKTPNESSIENAGVVDQQFAAEPASASGATSSAPGGDAQQSQSDFGEGTPSESTARPGKARALAGGLVGQAGDRARDYANAGKDAATERLDSFAGLVAGIADSLGDRLGPQTGDYARKAVDTVTQFAEGLKARDVDDLVDDTRRIIKQNPAMAIGAAAALGFVLVRLAKASPRDEA